MIKILNHLTDSIRFSTKITKKFFIALFMWNFYEYRIETFSLDFSKIRKNRKDPIEMKIIIRKSLITDIEKYKYGGGYMFNNPWNNSWRYYDKKMKAILV